LLVEAGGAAATGADAAGGLGLVLPELSPETQRRMTEILSTEMPPFATPRNPVDLIWTPANTGHGFYERCVRTMMAEVDSMVVVTYLQFDDRFAEMMSRSRDEHGKPLLFVPGHPTERRDGMSLLARYGLPAFTMPERALGALAAMLHRSHRLRNS
jgi:acyl-CoA synthetase (NDP forming)